MEAAVDPQVVEANLEELLTFYVPKNQDTLTETSLQNIRGTDGRIVTRKICKVTANSILLLRTHLEEKMKRRQRTNKKYMSGLNPDDLKTKKRLDDDIEHLKVVLIEIEGVLYLRQR